MNHTNVEVLCEKVVENTTFHPNDVQIDLTIGGYVSYIEVSGKIWYCGESAATIEKSLNNLKNKL